ncbi:MAG: arylesterase/paraoxonase [Polaribacter sp.]|jgi:arylesterase/paraoxonase
MVKKILLVTLIVISLFILKTLYQSGAFKTINNHSSFNNVQMYTNLARTEDLDIDRENGLLFISSSDRWNIDSSNDSKDGIYVLDLNDKKNEVTKPIRLSTTLKEAFHPHGISYLRKGDKGFLFAINHNIKGDFVEVFQFENGQLTHLKSYSNKLMCCPNDLVAVDVNKFYVTNDHGAAKGFGRLLEEYLHLANSYVLYYDGDTFSKVLENINYANGINVSNDGKTVYVTEASGGKRIFVMDRDIESGELSERFAQSLNTGGDNISVDENGDLWIGAHPKLLDFVGHAENSDKLSPSQVLKLTHSEDNRFEVEEIYLNYGEQISASSVALLF